MYLNNKILVGKNKEKELYILPQMANRHGLITGASGTGKTITLKVMAESFSDAGVPVFMADVKGDLAGTAKEGTTSESLEKRLEELNIPTNEFEYKKYPVRFWDLYQEYGNAIRVSIYDVGPSVLSIMLGLSEVQEGVLTIIYRIAHDEKKMIYDISDLKQLLVFVGENKKDYTLRYGNITEQSIGVIQRRLLTLENQGADKFFGVPSLDIRDFIKKTEDDERGYINILHAVELFNSPDLYAAFLLHLLNRLYNEMPEVGDVEKPEMVFFFDEAHLLFNEMPSYRLKQIVQVVKLIRSRGIGLYFVSQSPTDIPDEVLAQLGNRVQHNLRAYTPTELKAVKAAANGFRANPKFDTEEAIKTLGTGEALVSFQTEKGEPDIVEKVTILPPQSKMGTLDDETRRRIKENSPFYEKYLNEEEKEDAAHIVLAKHYAEKEEEKKKADEEKAEKDRKIEEEKEKKAKEKEKKSSESYKLMQKVKNMFTTKVISQGLSKGFKYIGKIFSSKK